MVKNLPASEGTVSWILGSLGPEDLLEKEIVTHSSILTWEIPWDEEPDQLWSMGFSRQEYWNGVSLPSTTMYKTDNL